MLRFHGYWKMNERYLLMGRSSFSEEQAQELASSVSVDKTNFSVSFNEFLRLFSQQQESEPDEGTLVDVFA